MTTNYSALKVVDLKKLLAERSLPQAGNKNELIARLTSSESPSSGVPAPAIASDITATKAPIPAPGPTIAPPAEDEIDWDDDPPTTISAAAGGSFAVLNSVAISDQARMITPAATKDLKGALAPTAPDPYSTATSGPAAAVAPVTASTTTIVTPASNSTSSIIEQSTSIPAPDQDGKPKSDFSRHLPPTSLEVELALRKKRAAKFGIVEPNADAIKALERAKKFGGSAETGELSGGGLGALDVALGEGRRGGRKRERDGMGGGEGEGNGRQAGAKRQDSRGVGERNGKAGSKGGRQEEGRAVQGRVTDDPSEKAKAEKRAARFGGDGGIATAT